MPSLPPADVDGGMAVLAMTDRASKGADVSLVERLRRRTWVGEDHEAERKMMTVMADAADTIERLTAERDEAREDLRIANERGDAWRDLLVEADRQRDTACAAIDRVRVLVDRWQKAAMSDNYWKTGPDRAIRPHLGDFRAALDTEEDGDD